MNEQASFEMFRKDKNIKKNNGIVIGKLGIGKCFKFGVKKKDGRIHVMKLDIAKELL